MGLARRQDNHAGYLFDGPSLLDQEARQAHQQHVNLVRWNRVYQGEATQKLGPPREFRPWDALSGMRRHGIRPTNAVFDDDTVREIRRRWDGTWSHAAHMAEAYGVSAAAVWAAARGDTYRDVEMDA